jgi:SpoVK/Ycf46/Vps4 family AAA+-type ATPase
LPVDLKRQGRAEVHIPLLYPRDNAEKKEMFVAMAKKVKFDISNFSDSLERFNLTEVNSGADIESILVKANRQSVLNKQPLTLEEFKQIVESFRTSLDKDKINAQIAAALAEITDRDLMP